MTYLNLGSGQRPFKQPWVNVDCQPRWKPDICLNICGGLGAHFPKDTVDTVCLHHVLEHFGLDDARVVLGECLRILKPGGSLLIFIPDLWELACMWREGRISDDTYMINLYGAYMGDEADRHKFGYTSKTLTKLLKEIGYGHVYPFNWREIKGADIARARWILAVEGIK